MTISEMMERKRELGYTNKIIAERTGLPLGTVQKIFSGATKAPRLAAVQALERLLAPQTQSNTEQPQMSSYPHHKETIGELSAAGCVRENAAAWYAAADEEQSRTQRNADSKGMDAQGDHSLSSEDPHAGWKTIDDYYALPEDRRVELIDGVFYDMGAPTNLHQAILGQLYLAFAPCVEDHPECELFFAPLDVRLDNDNYTMVQPDLLIVCERTDEDQRRINGAPDFVLEVLSPSNRAHDMSLKLGKYQQAGVREYWIVDPAKQKLIVYDLEHDDFPVIYTFDDTVPVTISNGECSIDFARIRAKIRRYLPAEKDPKRDPGDGPVNTENDPEIGPVNTGDDPGQSL